MSKIITDVPKTPHLPTCPHCKSEPLSTGTQLIPGPRGIIFALVFCMECGMPIPVSFIAVDASPIIKPN